MNLFKLMASLTLNSSSYEEGLNKAETKASTFGSTLKRGLGTIAKISGAALTAASGAVVTFGMSAVNAGKDFDASMSQVAATMGATVDEITELRDFAQEMGAKTAFSATQAADALNYMALAGYDAGTSMKMLPNVLNLAAAGGIELAAASDMVTDAQSALGLSLDETTALVDKMAQTSSKSNTSVAQLGDAILTVGGTAKNLKGGTTELAAVLGILADNGIKGAEGGTALRNILNSLSAPTDTASAMMDSLGISMFDAEGNMRSLNDVFLDLNKVLDSVSQEDRTKVISTLFNARDMKSAEALLANVGDRYNELTGYIDNAAGASQKMADTQLDNLAGDITLFQSALEGAKIAVSDKLTPTIRKFVQFGSSAVSKLSDAFKEGGLKGAMEALGDILSDGLKMVVDMLPELIKAGTSLLSALLQGVVDNLPEIANTVLTILEQLGTSLGQLLPTLFPAIAQAFVDIAANIVEHLPDLLSALMSIVDGIATGIAEAVPIIVEALPQIINGIVDFLTNKETLDSIIETGLTLLTSLIGAISQIIAVIVKALPDIIDALVEFFTDKDTIKSIIDAGIDLLTSLVANVKDIISAIVEALPQIITSIVEALTNPDTIKLLIEAGFELLSALAEAIPEVITELVKALPQIITSIVDALSKGWENIKSVGKDLLEGLWKGISEKATWLWGKVKEWAGGLLNGIKDFFGIHSPSHVFRDLIGKNIAYGLGEGIEIHGEYAIDKMKELGENILDAADIDTEFGVSSSGAEGSLTKNRFRSGVSVVQNIYASKMSPAEVFEQARQQQELLDWMGRGSFDYV